MMGKDKLRLPRLLALSLLAAMTLALSCSGSSSLNQPQPSAEVAGTPLPLTQYGAIPAVPDPVEIYVVEADGGDPKLVAALPGVPMWAWSSDDNRAALITDITDHSAKVNVISVKDGTDTASAEINGYPYGVEWSPSGEWLAWKSATQDGGTVEAMRADGSGRRELASVPGYGQGSLKFAGWADDNTLLVIQEDTEHGELLAFDLTSGEKRDVAALPGLTQTVALSKSTARLALITWASGPSCDLGSAADLWIVDLPDGSPRQALSGTCGLFAAAWSPDGGRIAYSLATNDDSRGVYSLDVASGASHRLGGSTTQFDEVRGWLPNGSAVVAARNGCPGGLGGFCIPAPPALVLISTDGAEEQVLLNETDYVLSPDGGTIVFDKDGLQFDQIPAGPSRQAMAADSDWQFNLLNWSPDGQWFSFARSHSRGNRQFEINADGSGLKRLADLADWEDWPAWDEGEVPSPDGSKVAVLGQPLQIKDAQSGNQVTVEGLRGGQASWSPDSKMLVFATCPSTDQDASAIYLADADGTRLKQLTDGSSHDCEPVFSPDGQRVAFVREQDKVQQVVVLDLDTLQESALFSVEDVVGGIGNVWPAWSPDGKLLAWSVQSIGIYVIKADGSGTQQVVATDWFGGQFVGIRWQSGSRLYFVSAQ